MIKVKLLGVMLLFSLGGVCAMGDAQQRALIKAKEATSAQSGSLASLQRSLAQSWGPYGGSVSFDGEGDVPEERITEEYIMNNLLRNRDKYYDSNDVFRTAVWKGWENIARDFLTSRNLNQDLLVESLREATKKDHPTIVRLLVERNVPSDVADEFGLSARDYAQSNPEVLEILPQANY